MRIIMNQEPLGVAHDIVSVGNLRRWSDVSPSHHFTDYSNIGEAPKHTQPPFAYDAEINHKIVLWWVLCNYQSFDVD